jgi:hypothetical protein
MVVLSAVLWAGKKVLKSVVRSAVYWGARRV